MKDCIDGVRVIPGAHTCPFPSSPIDPSQPFLLSHQPFLQQNPEPHQSHGPCCLPQPLQQSLPAFLNSFRFGTGAHTCPFPSSPIDPSQPFLVSHQPFLQHNPAPHQSHGPCRLPQPLQQSLPAFNNSFRQ